LEFGISAIAIHGRRFQWLMRMAWVWILKFVFRFGFVFAIYCFFYTKM